MSYRENITTEAPFFLFYLRYNNRLFVYYNLIYINQYVIICIAYNFICILKHFFQKFSELPLETICFKFFHKMV